MDFDKIFFQYLSVEGVDDDDQANVQHKDMKHSSRANKISTTSFDV